MFSQRQLCLIVGLLQDFHYLFRLIITNIFRELQISFLLVFKSIELEK